MNVRFDRVTKRFGRATILDAVSLEIQSGECVVLLGPSGCGKTTMLRLIAGLERAESGQIFIGDRVVNGVAPSERDVAMVFQNYALYPHLTVFENIAFPLVARKVPPGEVGTRVRDVARRLGLDGCLDRRPAQLSGGQQQRVALARAMVRNPAVYLMDEPLSNLDAQLRVQTRAELKRLQQELRTTTIHVTHDQAEAMTLGHRVAVLRGGRIEQFGAPLDLYRRPANRFVAEFLGSPSINIWRGAAGDGGVRAAGATIPVRPDVAAQLPSGGVDVGVRPESITVHTAAILQGCEAVVDVVEAVGNETIVMMTSAGERVIARIGPDVLLIPGQRVWFAPDPDKTLFFDPVTAARIPA